MTALAIALASLASIAPPVVPAVVDGPCPGREEVACTWNGGPIYFDAARVPSGNLGVEIMRHELGHHFDYQVMHDPQRDRFRALIGDARPWRTSPNSPHEQFAEAYSLCPVRHSWVYERRRGGYDYHPSWKRHRRVCLLIERAAALAAS